MTMTRVKDKTAAGSRLRANDRSAGAYAVWTRARGIESLVLLTAVVPRSKIGHNWTRLGCAREKSACGQAHLGRGQTTSEYGQEPSRNSGLASPGVTRSYNLSAKPH